MSVNKISPEDDAQRRKLHSYGLGDGEIAARVGLKRPSIRAWREKKGLARNDRTCAPKLTRKAHAERLALYRLGMSDRRIALIVQRCKAVIAAWRTDNGLPPHGKFAPTANVGLVKISTADEDRRVELYRRGMNDAAIAREVGRGTNTIHKWRNRRGLPLNERERNWDRPATSIVSMDADLGEGGFNRHALVADDAAAAWLEEMGATRW